MFKWVGERNSVPISPEQLCPLLPVLRHSGMKAGILFFGVSVINSTRDSKQASKLDVLFLYEPEKKRSTHLNVQNKFY